LKQGGTIQLHLKEIFIFQSAIKEKSKTETRNEQRIFHNVI